MKLESNSRINCISSDKFQSLLLDIKKSTPTALNLLPQIQLEAEVSQTIYRKRLDDQYLHIKRQIDGMWYLRYDIEIESTNNDDRNGLVLIDPSKKLLEASPEFTETYEEYNKHNIPLENHVDIYHRLVWKKTELSWSQLLAVAREFFLCNANLGVDKISMHHVNQIWVVKRALKNQFHWYSSNDEKQCKEIIEHPEKFSYCSGSNIYDSSYNLTDVIFDNTGKEVELCLVRPL